MDTKCCWRLSLRTSRRVATWRCPGPGERPEMHGIGGFVSKVCVLRCVRKASYMPSGRKDGPQTWVRVTIES